MTEIFVSLEIYIVPILIIIGIIILLSFFNIIFNKLSLKLIGIMAFLLMLFPILSFGLSIYFVFTDLYLVYFTISLLIGDLISTLDYSTALIYSIVIITIGHLFALIPGVQLYSIKTIISNQKLLQATLDNRR